MKKLGVVLMLAAVPILSSASTKLAAAGANKESKQWTERFDTSACRWSSTGRNDFFILEPGYRQVLDGREGKDPTHLEITVLNETKTLGGVETRVVEERVVEQRDPLPRAGHGQPHRVAHGACPGRAGAEGFGCSGCPRATRIFRARVGRGGIGEGSASILTSSCSPRWAGISPSRRNSRSGRPPTGGADASDILTGRNLNPTRF